MTSKANKIRIGLFTVTAGALLAIVLVVFGGLRFWEKKDRYTVLFEGTVMGLAPGAQVFLNGIRVGTVDDIALAEHDLRVVAVSISVAAGTPIRTDTRALLQIAGITGLRVIDLRDGSFEAARLAPGSAIPQGATLLDRLELQARTIVDESAELMKRANRIVDHLDALVDPENTAAVKQVLDSSRTAAANLADASASLKLLVRDNAAALHRTIVAAGDSARRAQEVIDHQVSDLLENTGELVLDLRGLVRDNGPAVRSAVFDLRQAARSFKDLTREVKAQPSRLLFGGAQRERRLP
ncbi:MAG: MCE family protein [Deltaproteobacteria bacterium]|nr:MCE family protein [Deltaproteobacteria bacterium]